MGNASDRTMPKKAYAKCVANEKVSHKKLVKKVTEHLRFFSHGMMEAVLEEVFNRLSEHLAQGDRVTLTASEHSKVSLKYLKELLWRLCSPRRTSRARTSCLLRARKKKKKNSNIKN